MSLGDSFPPELKQEVSNNALCPGQIIYLHCDFTTPQKNKYLLVASVEPLILMFVVNSKIPNYVMGKPDLLECQILLKADNYIFLDHDSYLACHQNINSFSREQVLAQITNDMSRIKGMVIAQDRDKIVTVLNKSRVLELDTRVDIIKGLQSIVYNA